VSPPRTSPGRRSAAGRNVGADGGSHVGAQARDTLAGRACPVSAFDADQLEALKVRDLKASRSTCRTWRWTTSAPSPVPRELLDSRPRNQQLDPIDRSDGRHLRRRRLHGEQPGVILDTFDSTNIQVLRGPQAPLRRNVTGGAVLVNTGSRAIRWSSRSRGLRQQPERRRAEPLCHGFGRRSVTIPSQPSRVYNNTDDGWFENELDAPTSARRIPRWCVRCSWNPNR
jgi:hypothetical protein